MNYNFTSQNQYIGFLSSLREGDVGEQSAIYYDDKNGKVIKIFTLTDYSEIRKKEEKIRELIKYKNYFPNATLPEQIIKCNGRCCGYVMTMLKNYKSLGDFRKEAYLNKEDRMEVLKIACKLAELVKNLHSKGIVIGDFHPDQFMTKNGEIYVCDTDTWGITKGAKVFEADKVGKEEYIDPLARDFNAKDLLIKEYTQDTDNFSLAVVVFKMLVGFNPFAGKYRLVPKYKMKLKALKGISIIGNHTFTEFNFFTFEHIAWMPKELQNDFLMIFEGRKRFNILQSLKIAEKELIKCNKGHYYNSSRYSECPICNQTERNTLQQFRTYKLDYNLYEKFTVYPEKNVRRVIDYSTYFDFDGHAICVKNDGTSLEEDITSKVEEIHFVGNDIIVKLERMSKVKLLFHDFFDDVSDFYQDKSNKEKIKNEEDIACNLIICNVDGQKLYSSVVMKKASRLNIIGNYLFYINGKKQLIKVVMTPKKCIESVIYEGYLSFSYGINKNGDYCICALNSNNKSDIIINGQKITQLTDEFSKRIRFDEVGGGWCLITQKLKSKDYSCYVINKNGKIFKEFEDFSFIGLNLQNVIYYNWMLVAPSYKKVVFLKSGKTIVDTEVNQINIGVVNRNSKISIIEDQKTGSTFFFFLNENQSYKFRLI